MSNKNDKAGSSKGGSGKGSGKAGGGSHRLERVEKEIRDVVGLYLISGFRGSLPGIVSLTRVRVSPDLKVANMNFTLLLTQDENEAPEMYARRATVARKQAEKDLNEQAKDVQAQLASKLKMRFTPRVQFHYDDAFESAMKVESILRDMSSSAGRGEDLPSTKFTDDTTRSEEGGDLGSEE